MTDTDEIRPEIHTQKQNYHRTIVILTTLMAVTGLVEGPATVGLIPLVGTISTDLGLSPSQFAWLFNVLLLTSAATLGLLARLADLRGPRQVLIGVNVAGMAGALICALSSNFVAILIGRALLGIGLATGVAVWGLVRPVATPIHMRRLSITFGTAVGVNVASCLVLGSVMLAVGAPWRLLYWISATGYFLSIILSSFSPEAPKEARKKLPLDWLGGIGLGIWLVAFLLFMDWIKKYGFASAPTLIAGAVFLIIFVAWVIQQIKTPHRLMTFAREDLRQMLIGYTGIWLISIVPNVFYAYLPIIMKSPEATGYGLGMSPLASAFPFIMIAPGAALANLLANRMIVRIGPRWSLICSAAIGLVGFVGLGFVSPHVVLLYVWTFLFGLGIFTCYNCGYALTAASGRQHNISVTLGLQAALGYGIAAVCANVILGALTPNPDGSYSSETLLYVVYTACGVIVAFIVIWLFLASRKLVDRHAAKVYMQEDAAQPATATAID